MKSFTYGASADMEYIFTHDMPNPSIEEAYVGFFVRPRGKHYGQWPAEGRVIKESLKF